MSLDGWGVDTCHAAGLPSCDRLDLDVRREARGDREVGVANASWFGACHAGHGLAFPSKIILNHRAWPCLH